MASFHSVWAPVQDRTAWRAVVSSNPVTGSSLLITQLFVGGEDLPIHHGAGTSGGVGWRGTAGPPGRLGSACFPRPCCPLFCSLSLGFWGLRGTSMGKAILQGMLSSYSALGGHPEPPLSPQQGCSV